jgi:DNA repair protein RadD
VIAMLAKKALSADGRVLVLAHRKELLEQNAGKIKAHGVDVGLYSAGLGKRDLEHDVICGGIQSIYRKAADVGARHLVLIDEVHLVAEEGMYKTFLSDLRTICPKVRLVGLTATPFRTGDGSLCRPDSLFQKVCYSAPIRKLIDEGFLCNLVTSPAENAFDTSSLRIRGGEFIPQEMANLFSSDFARIESACREILEKTQDRKSVLVFCAGIVHAGKVAETLESMSGEECGLVTGDTSPLERASLLARFKAGDLRRLCNCDVLTTGFDAPRIDALAILRATASPGLLAQMCGRGLRTAPDKTDCLILDFGQNIKRHGPIDAPDFGSQSKSKRGEGGDAPQKICPNCEESNPLAAVFCACGFKFPPKPLARHDGQAGEESILQLKTRWFVEEVYFSRHKKKTGDGPDTLRIDYVCQPEEEQGNLSSKTISEWVCLEHEGFALTKARRWWKARCARPVQDVEEALALFARGAVSTPHHITTESEGKFIRIVGHELDPIPPEDEWTVTDDAPEEDLAEVPF